VHGPLAVGLSGEDANLITAGQRDEALGYVGDVVEVDPILLSRLLAQGLIPVVATIGADEDGQAYNINADTVAGAIAGTRRREARLFSPTWRVAHRRRRPRLPAAHGDSRALDDLVASGGAAGGMVPKVEACAQAVRRGVVRAHILDGRVPHALLLEFVHDGGVGTMVDHDRPSLPHGTYPEPPVTFVRGEGSVLSTPRAAATSTSSAAWR